MTEPQGLTEADEARRNVRAALARGEYLIAFDDATAALDTNPRDLTLRYLMILALARAGATDQALEALASSELESHASKMGTALDLQEDIAALRARLAKDRALIAHDSERQQRARLAAELYEAIYRNLGRAYSCINAATMWLVAGNRDRARSLAAAALDLTRTAIPDDDAAAYWNAATEAEIALHLGDEDLARDALERASTFAGGDLSAVATTRKQLLLVCELQGLGADVLAPLAVPAVVHYGGHMMAAPGQPGRIAADAEPRATRAIKSVLERKSVGFGFGSLACGADILLAESLLDRGSELNVVLPFEVEEFKEISVASGGTGWVGRFDNCLKRAASVTFATTGAFLGDESLFAYCTQLAMGHALIRAEFLAAPVEQVVLWDRTPGPAESGTGADVRLWQASHHETEVITIDDTGTQPATSADARRIESSGRLVRAILFADVKEFSKLPDSCIPAFLREVMTPLGEVLDRFAPHILYRNTWGDGLYVVLDTVAAAARCALELQDVMKSLSPAEAGLPEHLALRIGAHVGPVFAAEDPVLRVPSYFGNEVTRTARIEPRTPAGDVYVTDPFAALLVLEGTDDLSCQYVGHIPTAKDYGTFPMYVLKRRV